MVDPEECLRQFNQFIRHHLIQRVRERLIRKAPAIDWSKVDIRLDAEANGFYIESQDPQLDDQLQLMFAQLSND